MRPSKKHDQKILVIKATSGLSKGSKISGRYIHLPRQNSFNFQTFYKGYTDVFSRNEWEVVNVLEVPVLHCDCCGRVVPSVSVNGYCDRCELDAYGETL